MLLTEKNEPLHKNQKSASFPHGKVDKLWRCVHPSHLGTYVDNKLGSIESPIPWWSLASQKSLQQNLRFANFTDCWALMQTIPRDPQVTLYLPPFDPLRIPSRSLRRLSRKTMHNGYYVHKKHSPFPPKLEVSRYAKIFAATMHIVYFTRLGNLQK